MDKRQRIFDEDSKAVFETESIDWDKLRDSAILITGATGLIGTTLLRALTYANRTAGMNIHVTLLVRDRERALKLLQEACIDCDAVDLLVGSTENFKPEVYSFDYIIHAACPTASAFFVGQPVETIRTSVLGTMNLLETARLSGVKGMVYLSSMEAYGEVLHENLLKESDLGYIDLENVRSSYSESKRMCELLVKSYAVEYKISVCSLRLAQPFGPGIRYDDRRVFAMMARCAMEGKNICLSTAGKSRHGYLYSAQAVSALLTVLLSGEQGSCYNAVNPATYCSIYEMGQMVASALAGGKISVEVAQSENTGFYPADSFLNMDISRISGLGWQPEGDLKMLYTRMMEAMI